MFASSIEIKKASQLRAMRRAGLLVHGMLQEVRAAIAPGVTTADLDAIADAFLTRAGATSNFKGYYGYPATICASVNDRVVHGIPDSTALAEGDVISVDAGCYILEDGAQWHGDSAFTVIVGEGSETDRALVDATEEALWAAIAALAGASRLGVVGEAVEDVMAAWERKGHHLEIVRDFVGHGIGRKMHMPPDVPNFATREKGPRLKSGMCFAIEPIISAGKQANEVLDDEWTVVTRDGSRAAHWEHSVAIVDGGVHVLTAPDAGAAGLAPYGVTPVAL